MKRILTVLVAAGLAASGVAAQKGDEPQERSYGNAWELIRGEHDKNGDGKVTPEEYTRGEARFKRLDRDGDGVITEEDFRRRSRGRMDPGAMLVRLMDTDRDRKLTKEEIGRWIKERDGNGDGVLGADELGRRGRMIVRFLDRDDDGKVGAADVGKVFDEADEDGDGVLKAARRSRRGSRERGGRGQRSERPRAPQVGEAAPDFQLHYKDGKAKAKLSSFKGEKPVALIFGSYT